MTREGQGGWEEEGRVGRGGGERRKASNYTEEVVPGLDFDLVRRNDHCDYSDCCSFRSSSSSTSSFYYYNVLKVKILPLSSILKGRRQINRQTLLKSKKDVQYVASTHFEALFR